MDDQYETLRGANVIIDREPDTLPEHFFYPDTDGGIYVFHLILPGSRVAHKNLDGERELEAITNGIIRAFFSANAALNQYLKADKMPYRNVGFHATQAKMAEIDRSLREKYKRFAEADPNDGPEEQRRKSNAIHLSYQIEQEYLIHKANWERGGNLMEIAVSPILYARSFLLAVDMFAKCMRKLAGVNDSPQAAKDASAQIDAVLPDLSGVRNSFAHREDRMLGMAWNKPIPIVDVGISSGGGRVLVLEALDNDRYQATMADGHIGSVHVSAETLLSLRSIMLSAFEGFDWLGAPTIRP